MKSFFGKSTVSQKMTQSAKFERPKVKAEKNLHNQSFQSISRVRKNLSFSQTPTKQNTPAIKKCTVHEFREKVQFFLEYFHKNTKLNFYSEAIKFLNKDFENHRVQLGQRFVRIVYLQPSVKYMNFLEIQAEIITEWKKNTVLYVLQNLWFNSLLKYDFQNPQDFSAQYEAQRNFIAEFVYDVFAPFLTNLQQRGIDVHERLYEETAHLIITQYSKWQKVYKSVMDKLFKKKYHQDDIDFKFDLSELGIKKKVLDISDLKALPQTKQAILQFTKQFKLTKKIKKLQDIRKKFEEQLRRYQGKLISTGQLRQFHLLEKDDIISCFIYAIITGKIENLPLSIRYFKFILGKSCHKVLQRWGSDVYLSDIQSCVQYLQEFASSPEMKKHSITNQTASQ